MKKTAAAALAAREVLRKNTSHAGSTIHAESYGIVCGANIRVNAICPGLIQTGMTQPLYDLARAAGKEERIGHLNPMKD